MNRLVPSNCGVLSRMCAAIVLVVLAGASPVLAGEFCPFACGDLDGSGEVDLDDFALLEDCMGQSPSASLECLCSDLDGSDEIDLRDFSLFVVLFGRVSDEMPPDCTGVIGSTVNLTAYRPQHGVGYAPFARVAVADVDEEDELLGAGIRINSPDDTDPLGEDDLIEVRLSVDPAGAQLALRRSDEAIAVWATRDKQPGTEIDFVDDRSYALPLLPSQTELTLWAEWTSSEHGIAELHVEPIGAALSKDALVFHTFESIVVALGGEDQAPSDPAESTMGTFAVAIDLYRLGYDVHMFDEDLVSADGTGPVFDEVADAIQNRGVEGLAIFGYSHGAGSTYSLASLLDDSRPTLGFFEILFTSYVDAVRNNSDVDMAQELRWPPSSLFHLNQYQHGSFLQDLGLDGGPIDGSNPPPSGLDVETTPWGSGATHFEIDDFEEVRDLILENLELTVTR